MHSKSFKNNYATKYEKLDVYTYNLQNNYTKLENRKYTTNYEKLTMLIAHGLENKLEK